MKTLKLHDPFMPIINHSTRALEGFGVIHFANGTPHITGYQVKFEDPEVFDDDTRLLVREHALAFDDTDTYLSEFEDLPAQLRANHFSAWANNESIEHEPVDVSLVSNIANHPDGTLDITTLHQNLWNLGVGPDEEYYLLVQQPISE